MSDWNFSARLNSFKTKANEYWEDREKITTLDLIERISRVHGLTHVELNYPQHFSKHSIEEIEECLQKNNVNLSGIALRYDDEFIEGEFTNSNNSIRNKAIEITNDAIEVCRRLGGSVTTIWLPNDGFDYAFQLDYQRAWNEEVSAIKEIAEKNPDMKISFEYKPYEPRVYSLVGDVGTTLLAVEDTGCNNVGVTLDFCHMLMKKESPSFSLSLVEARGKLFGVHLNDGYKDNDDGMMLGSVHLMQTLELVYYLKKFNYSGLIYFDTFPLREDPVLECEMNIKFIKGLARKIDELGMEHIQRLIESKDAVASQQLLCDLLNLNETSTVI